MYVMYDSVCERYLFTTRPYYGYIPGFQPIDHVEVVRHRMARMWESRDLVQWED